MSTRITEIFDALITQMGVLYPTSSGWNRLANPYKPEESPDVFLKQGWGLALGPGTNTERCVGCEFSIQRDLVLTLTRRHEALENDAGLKASMEKQILEDQYGLVNYLEQNVSVGGVSIYTKFVSDSGIEYIRGDTDKFLMLRTNLSFEYFENFT